jgi:hypothetical protein
MFFYLFFPLAILASIALVVWVAAQQLKPRKVSAAVAQRTSAGQTRLVNAPRAQSQAAKATPKVAVKQVSTWRPYMAKSW